MKEILQKEQKVLRQVAKEVPIKEIKSLKVKKILREMSSALRSQGDGVALAAPQIGYSLRIFVVSHKIFEEDFVRDGVSQTDGSRGSAGAAAPDSDRRRTKSSKKDLIFINPKISKLSKEKEWVPEGCLSVRPLYGKTFRSKKAIVTAYDEKGKKITRGATGLLAQIFQHETDHLNGILFIDHAVDVKEESYEK